MRTCLNRRTIVIAALAATMAGCALKSPPTTDELQQQALPHTAVPTAWTASGGTAVPVADRWLVSFDDAALTALVTEALAFNADLQVAAARVEQAAGYVKVASGALWPSVGVAGLTGGKSGGGGGLDGIWLNASLELDIWGRLRYGSAAAEEQAAAFAADYAYARQSLAATVAKAWFLAIEAGLQRAIAQDAVRAADALQGVAQDRFRIGNGNEQAVAEARASAGTYRDRLREIEQAREQALARARAPRGALSGCRDRRRRPADINAAARTGRHAVGAARAPSRCGRRGAPRRRRVRSRGRGARGDASADQPDRRGQQRVERTDRVEEHEQPHLELRRQPDRTAVSGRRAARAGRDSIGGAEAGGRRVRACGPAGVRRSRERARGRECAARPLRHSRGYDPRQRTRTGARANPVSRG